MQTKSPMLGARLLKRLMQVPQGATSEAYRNRLRGQEAYLGLSATRSELGHQQKVQRSETHRVASVPPDVGQILTLRIPADITSRGTLMEARPTMQIMRKFASTVMTSFMGRKHRTTLNESR